MSQNIASFAHIYPKLALKYTIFFNIQKGQKWPNGQIIIFLANRFKKAKFIRFGL